MRFVARDSVACVTGLDPDMEIADPDAEDRMRSRDWMDTRGTSSVQLPRRSGLRIVPRMRRFNWLVLAVVVGAAVWAWRTGKFSNPHLVNPTEQWAEAAERWSKGKAAEAIAILRTTAAGEAIYQTTIKPAMDAAKGGA